MGNKNKGFTLIELSVVIVIIGLIVAGIVGGQSLVHQSKLRAVVSNVSSLQVAYNTFYLEYNKLPGDMSNASDYWTGAIDGNGNFRIDTGTDHQNVISHLNLSGIMHDSKRNSSSLVSPLQPAYYFNWYSGMYGKVANALQLTLSGWAGGIDTSDAVVIDKKMDDGLADTGIARSAKGVGLPADHCTQGTNSHASASAVYNLSDTTKNSCWVNFYIWPK